MTQAQTLDLLFPNAAIREQVLAYCATYQITRQFQAAVELASEVYKQAKHLSARMQADPETDQDRVVIDVAVAAPPDEVLRQKKEYTQRWVQIASPEVRDRIRVLYHFI